MGFFIERMNFFSFFFGEVFSEVDFGLFLLGFGLFGFDFLPGFIVKGSGYPISFNLSRESVDIIKKMAKTL